MKDVEFCFRAALCLLPMLWWINGPAVSMDQVVVRWSLAIATLGGCAWLRLRAARASGEGGGHLSAIGEAQSENATSESA